MDEKEQLRRLKAFVNKIIDANGSDYEVVRDIAEDHGLIRCVNQALPPKYEYKKADWLKDENE